MNPLLIGPIADLLGKGIDRLFPDPEQKARAQLELIRMQQDGEFKKVEQQLSAILAEANSSDPWTSRARPSFLYVFYFILIFLIIIAPALGVFFPDRMTAFFANVGLGFAAIPEELWWTFGAGYLGYAGARTIEKSKSARTK
jgi:hypothetical protein